MHNRIRYYRKRLQMTLAQVADKLGTTPQTISRLETEAMTLSMDWLRRFADLFDVHVADLLEPAEQGDMPLVGEAGGDGAIASREDARFSLDVLSVRPIAIRVAEECGPYGAGEILVCSRFEGDQLHKAVGGDCVVALRDGTILLRRLIRSESGRHSLVPIGPSGEVMHGCDLTWAARVVMRVRYV